MPKKLGYIEGKLKKRKIARDIYNKEYNKLKADYMRKARKQSIENIKKQAREDAKKLGLSPSEQKEYRKKKLNKFMKQLQKGAKTVQKGAKSLQKEAQKAQKSRGKKGSDPFFNLDVGDLFK